MLQCVTTYIDYTRVFRQYFFCTKFSIHFCTKCLINRDRTRKPTALVVGKYIKFHNLLIWSETMPPLWGGVIDMLMHFVNHKIIKYN